MPAIGRRCPRRKRFGDLSNYGKRLQGNLGLFARTHRLPDGIKVSNPSSRKRFNQGLLRCSALRSGHSRPLFPLNPRQRISPLQGMKTACSRRRSHRFRERRYRGCRDCPSCARRAANNACRPRTCADSAPGRFRVTAPGSASRVPTAEDRPTGPSRAPPNVVEIDLPIWAHSDEIELSSLIGRKRQAHPISHEPIGQSARAGNPSGRQRSGVIIGGAFRCVISLRVINLVFVVVHTETC